MATALEWHDQQRRAGRPVVSSLIGPVAVAVHHWRSWCRESGRTPVVVPTPEPDRISRRLAEVFLSDPGVLRVAEGFLARRCGRETTELRLSARTVYELRLLCDSATLGEAGPDRLCRRLLAARAGGEPLTAEALLGWFAEIEGRPERLAAFFGAWEDLAPGRGPALLVVPDADAQGIHGIPAAARTVASLVSHAPRAAVGVGIPRAAFEDYLARTPESFAKAVLRESAVPVAGLDADAIRRLVEDRLGPAADRLRPAIDRLARSGATPELAARFAEAAAESWPAELPAARSPGPPADSTSPANPTSAAPVAGALPPAPDSGTASRVSTSGAARSAAEAYLHEVLEGAPDLCGLFELNATADFPFGNQPAEIDLACRPLRIAIEIDGYYHFGDPVAYRRDRRKDWMLQRHGYLVLRFLAEDIVPEAENICETIRAAVRWRREMREMKEMPVADAPPGETCS